MLKHKRLISHIIKLVVLISIVWLILWVCFYAWTLSKEVPTYQQVVQETQSSFVQILDREGQSLIAIREDFQQRKVPWTVLSDYSTVLQNMVVQSEDKRFYQHHGVDWLAWLNAIQGKIFSNTSRGASTITMQLVGMIIPDLQRQGKQRSYIQKIKQIAYALRLEREWTKEQILEAYLNKVPLRGEVVGMASGAKTFFQKYPYALNQRESALLVAMLKAPNANEKVLLKRTCVLLSASCEYMDMFVKNSIRYSYRTFVDESQEGRHFAYAFLKKYREKLSKEAHEDTLSSITNKTLLALSQPIKSTIDGQLQKFVRERVKRRLMDLFREQISDAAVVVLDNRTGEILAYIGSSEDLSQAQDVDHAQALRQAGSTLKPFLYAQVFDERHLTAASLLNDDALSIAVDTGLYIPQNYDKGFKGWVSVRTALASSLNIPAVQTLTMLGVEPFHALLVQLGLPLTEEGDFYGYSLALGSADVSLLSLTNAYRSLANQGYYTPVKWFLEDDKEAKSNNSVAVISPQSAWIIQSILSDRQARALTFGLDSALSTPFDTAVKTGTSKDMRDNWTIGWSSRYTVGVWVGNSAGQSMRNISGVSGAAPIWHDVMKYLHQNTSSFFSTMPEGVVSEQIDYIPMIEPSRKEYFLFGTEMKKIELVSNVRLHQQGARFISMPTDGTIIALDPDIPRENQRLRLEAKTVNQQLATQIKWLLNGKEVSQDNPTYIDLYNGYFKLELFSLSDNKLDQIEFQVRGTR